MSTDSSTEVTPSPVVAAPTAPASSLPKKRVDLAGNVIATGRRKSAIARVRLRSGAGAITVNKRPLDVYFPSLKDRELVSGALGHVGQEKTVDVDITVHGGGASGQATDVEIRANELLRWKKELTEIYEKTTGQPLQKLKDDMERDKFMNADEAVAYGLVDKVITNRVDDDKE